VKLSDSLTVKVGKISWPGYCRLKGRFEELLASDVLPGVADILATPIASSFVEGFTGTGKTEGPPNATLIADSSEAIRKSLPCVLDGLRKFLSGFDSEFVMACLGSEVDPDLMESLSAEDVFALRDAALELNDPAAMLETEKNFLGRVGTSVMQLIGTGQSSPPAGGPATSTSSPRPTAGGNATSTP